MAHATVGNLSVADMATRLGLHPATVEMMLKAGIMEGEQQAGEWVSSELALARYRADPQKMAQGQAVHTGHAVLKNLQTALHSLLDLNMGIAELYPPEQWELVPTIQQMVCDLIDGVLSTIVQDEVFIAQCIQTRMTYEQQSGAI